MNYSEAASAPLFGIAPLVIGLPLAGLLINLIFGRRWLKGKAAGIVASLAAGGAFGVALTLLVGLGSHPEAVVLRLAEWISLGDFRAAWELRIDTLSVTMMLVVAGVGTLIHIYATGYMAHDVHHNGDPGRYRRFFVYFNLFLVAMMILVSANNYLMLFVGWEGVGLCSYLLIGFWFEKGKDNIGNARAAQKAFVVNRIGDFGLLLALFMLFWWCGTLDFEAVFAAAPHIPAGVVLAITLCMLLGVAGKSAQIPLYVWLPDAMAGPTPVSALIHAATMVTAGVYLIVRSFALFALAPVAQDVAMWVGAATALFAATIAVGQFDIKKVLAYSTISQLGFMVAAAGMGATSAAMFHLTTHAFFKALLFLSAGSVILGMERGHEHAAHGEHEAEAHAFDPQDMRNMGGLRKRMKSTFWVYLIGALALAGIAPLAGFFSKDEILGVAFAEHLPVFLVLAAAAFLTAFYMGRQVLMVFFGRARTAPAEKATESEALILAPLGLLALLSVFGGALNLPGVLTLEKWLHHSIQIAAMPAEGFTISMVALGIALLGLFCGWLVYGRASLGAPTKPDPLALSLRGVFTALQNKWWVDELYGILIVRPYRYLADEVLAKWFDQEVIDRGANDLGGLARLLASAGSALENGYVRTYAISIVFGVVVMLSYLLLK